MRNQLPVLFLLAFLLFLQVDSAFLYNMTRNKMPPAFGTSVPSKGQSRTDPNTGAVLKRMTNRADVSSTDSLIVYSRFSPVNSGNTMALIHGGDSTSAWVIKIADQSVVRVLQHTGARSIGEVNEIRWDSSGSYPNRVYYTYGLAFYQMDVVTGVVSLLRDFSSTFPGPFPNGALLINDVEGDSSIDNRYWAWQIISIELNGPYRTRAILTYDKQTNTILGILTPEMFPKGKNYAGMGAIGYDYKTLGYLPRPNMVEISPKGTKAVIHFDRCYTGNRELDSGSVFDGPHAWPLNLAESSTAPNKPVRVAADATHSGWSFGLDGVEYFVSQNSRNDWIEAVKISDGSVIQLIHNTDWDPGYTTGTGLHIGKFYKKRGWAFISFYGSQGTSITSWGDHQLIMVELKANPKILRISPTYMTYPGDEAYRNEAQAALSMDGNQVWWTSNWGKSTAGYREAYMIQLPLDWDAVASGVTPSAPSTPSTPVAQPVALPAAAPVYKFDTNAVVTVLLAKAPSEVSTNSFANALAVALSIPKEAITEVTINMDKSNATHTAVVFKLISIPQRVDAVTAANKLKQMVTNNDPALQASDLLNGITILSSEEHVVSASGILHPLFTLLAVIAVVCLM